MTEPVAQFHPLPGFQRLLVTIAVMSATLLQVLDITIVNVSLPYMQGSLGATSDQIAWVLTSYLVASVIFMPLTGYFYDRYGQKKYLLWSIGGFILSSALCGAATSLTEIIIFRLLQGIFGAALVPLSQSIMLAIYPEKERGSAMALWGMGVMVGPILGPSLGGWLTEIASWRWNFYINIPFGIISFLLAMLTVPDSVRKAREMDWTGLLLISVSIGALQYLLDRGNQAGWFAANDICLAFFLTVTCFPLFLLHNLREIKNPVFEMQIFRDRNFLIASILLAVFGLGMFGSMMILPLFMENLLNYPVVTTGFIMAPRGITAMMSMMLMGRLISRVDSRYLVFIGILLVAGGSYISTFYNFSIDMAWIVVPILLQGFGLGMIFIPLSDIAFSTLSPLLRAEAAGLYSLLRTLGGSIGISVVSTLLARNTQIVWNHLGGFVNPFNPALQGYLSALHLSSFSGTGLAVLALVLRQQAHMIAFIDVFAFITMSFLLMLPFIFFLKKPSQLFPKYYHES